MKDSHISGLGLKLHGVLIKAKLDMNARYCERSGEAGLNFCYYLLPFNGDFNVFCSGSCIAYSGP